MITLICKSILYQVMWVVRSFTFIRIENIYFTFLGLGNFFCGYSAKDQLLRFLLQHDVIILDINGVDIKVTI